MINIMLRIFYHNSKDRLHIKIWISGFSLKEKKREVLTRLGHALCVRGGRALQQLLSSDGTCVLLLAVTSPHSSVAVTLSHLKDRAPMSL